jgi:hypothetical protein
MESETVGIPHKEVTRLVFRHAQFAKFSRANFASFATSTSAQKWNATRRMLWPSLPMESSLLAQTPTSAKVRSVKAKAKGKVERLAEVARCDKCGLPIGLRLRYRYPFRNGSCPGGADNDEHRALPAGDSRACL